MSIIIYLFARARIARSFMHLDWSAPARPSRALPCCASTCPLLPRAARGNNVEKGGMDNKKSENGSVEPKDKRGD